MMITYGEILISLKKTNFGFFSVYKIGKCLLTINGHDTYYWSHIMQSFLYAY